MSELMSFNRPFHIYTMKQAIQEGFILDVLRNYTTIDSWYRIMKTVEDDPMFDKKRAQKKLRAFVEGNPDVIAKKAAMMVEQEIGSIRFWMPVRRYTNSFS